MLSAVSIELERYDWTGRSVAYGYFDNYLLIQGNMFAPAVDLVPALCAALATELPRPARTWVLYLIGEIVSADVHIEEPAQARIELPERAKEHARAALWLFYHELCHGRADLAYDILEEIEPDRDRLARFEERARDQRR
ncbi:hypothetical protein ACIOD2_00415 [Amycolatopsis sp. NPDC088138]|uniref:hypothetical protein n=1 Tax=Amycolatopsis sp. NPDC088138 TaxID=3363938 RepID=UPI00382E25A9